MRGSKTTNKLIALAVALAAVAVPAGYGSAGSYRTRSEKLAPGVKYTVIRDPRGPWRIRIVSIRLDRPATIDVALAQDRLPGFETTSSMARRYGALVAINGDYARPSGRPVFTFAADGELAQTELSYGRNFSVDASERTAFFGHPETQVTLTLQDGRAFAVKWVNTAYDETKEHVAAFTPRAGKEAEPPPSACSARLRQTDAYRLDASGVASAPFYVEKVRCDGFALGKKGGTVVSAPAWSATGQALATLPIGSTARLSWSLGWPGVLDTIGGNPTLIENGVIVPGNVYGTGPFFNRHPRTAVALTAEQRVLFVVVDGRRKRYSVGMTLAELAELLRSLGATWALNLDGGGSTTMVINGEVVNRPSDRDGERGVSSALLLLPGSDPGEASPEPPGPLPPSGAQRQAWDAIASDPASTAGLADALARAGYALPPALRRAARSLGR